MMETDSPLGGKLQDTLEQVGSLRRAAGRKFSEARRETANVIKDSASSVREAGEALDQLAERAATRLDRSAAYVRSYDLNGLVPNLRQSIRRHPAGFVTGAVAAGLLIGLAIRGKGSICSVCAQPKDASRAMVDDVDA
ncbi:hypothetical protein [uncultured Paludibaculum sp.]|uniref:hypothetical protein n=1 Tax=uncultured Paludibaculum sp. TaxID=1765020 RepID=UPI002AAA7698|nr:hypothetical protein [uncultured Paludibaculum sp.]